MEKPTGNNRHKLQIVASELDKSMVYLSIVATALLNPDIRDMARRARRLHNDVIATMQGNSPPAPPSYDKLLAACRQALREYAQDPPEDEHADYVEMWPSERQPTLFDDMGFADVVMNECENLYFSDMARIVEGKQVILTRYQALDFEMNTPIECLRWALIEQLKTDLLPFLAEITPESD